MSVSSRALTMLAEALRGQRRARRTRWRRLDAGRQALLVLAYLRQGETYADLASGFGIGLATVFRYIHEALAVLAAMATALTYAVETARRKAFVILDGTLLRIDRVGMTGGRERPFYSGRQKRHGLNVQVLADTSGRLIWTSPALPGARHDMGAAREHGVLDALEAAGVRVIADNAYRGARARTSKCRTVVRPVIPSPASDVGGCRPTKGPSTQHMPGYAAPGERANAQLKAWKVLRKIRTSPRRATRLVDAVRSVIHVD